MSNYTLRPAQRGNAKPLVGLYGESGSGKTWSALLLARGFAGPSGKIAMIETEAGRGEIYSGVDPVGEYLVRPLGEPFSPARYGDAITDCEKAKVDALIIDSGSHEWEAVGGVLDMAAANEEKGWKGQIVWTKPKMEHSRHFVLRFAQTPIPLVILCLRAKYPLEEYVDERGKKQMRRVKVPVPIQSDQFISEMLIHGWLDTEHKIHISKYPDAIPEMRGLVPNLQPITTDTGKRLATWAAGTQSAASSGIYKTTISAKDMDADTVRVPPNKESAAPPNYVASSDPPDGEKAGAADPTDDELAVDIARWMREGKYDLALDLTRGIRDAARRESAIIRIRTKAGIVA